MTDHQQAGKQAAEFFGCVGERENRANKTAAPKSKPKKYQQWSRGLLKLIFEGRWGALSISIRAGRRPCDR
ncbi:MAG: hypothetical protein WBE93_10870, partial [Pseudolabrys sp.]